MVYNRRSGRRFNEDESFATEKPETKILPSLSPRGAKLRQELLTKIIPWEEITVSLHNFPYYIQDDNKSILLECVASNLKNNNLRKYGARLKSSNGRIMLQTVPGTELYRERLVSAVAREMKVPFLKLKLDDHHGCDDDDGGKDSAYESDEENYTNNEPTFNKGDRVQYVGNGNSISFEEVNNRTLSYGQRGEVYEVKGNTVAVVFNICGLIKKEAAKEEENTEILRQALVVRLHVRDITHDRQVRIHDLYIAMEVLCEVLESQQPMIVYFPDSFLWPPSSQYEHKPFVRVVKKIFNQLPEGAVMICAENNSHDEIHKLNELPKPLQNYFKKTVLPIRYRTDTGLHKLFTNSVWIKPPKDEDLANTFVEQIDKDRLTVISEDNLKTMHQVLKDANLSCVNLEDPIITYKTLTREEVEKIVGWALNHYSSSCPLPSVNKEKLHIPLDSIKLAISRLVKEEDYAFSTVSNKSIQGLASGYEEERLVSAVVVPKDIDVKFDDVGAPENVKKLLYQTIVLPMSRPELFPHGNLFKPCKGILLFGPPGTGKTLIAKALAKESGANFINITAEAFTSMRHSALFSYARKLAPVIIFLDEVDIMLGDRSRDTCYKNPMNEFLAAWDGLDSEERQRILVIGATSRPFDLDEALIHRMPKRIYVGLPDLENRCKLLKILLSKENLESGFSFEQLAEATDGYSESDLENLCAAAAYRPIEELLELESKMSEATDEVPALRQLRLHDFIHSKSEVRPSVASNASSLVKLREWMEQYGERENQRQQNN